MMKRVLGCAVVALIVLAIMPYGFLLLELPIQILLTLGFGWVAFLWRVGHEIKVDLGGVFWAVVCLTVFAVGSHRFFDWLRQHWGRPEASPGRSRWKVGWTAAAVATVLLLFVAGLATVGIVHQVGWMLASRTSLRISGYVAARRAQSINNLKQIGLGLDAYQSAHEFYPPGAVFDSQGTPLHGWQTMILPYVEQSQAFNRIRLDLPWNDPRNRDVFEGRLTMYENPGIRESVKPAGYAPSHYAANVLILGGSVPKRPRDIADGASNTFMAGEAPDHFKAWGDPISWRDPALGLNKSPDGFGGPYVGGANFTFVDGSVRFLRNSIDPNVFKALSTPAGGETIPPDSDEPKSRP